MANLPCPRCGNPKTLGTFCKDCMRELHPIVRSMKPTKIVLCAACDHVKLHSDWKTMHQDSALQKAVAHALQFGDAQVMSVEVAEAAIERKPGIKKTAKVMVVITAQDERGSKYDEDYDVPVQYEVTLCPNCAKKGSAYYEGILQIRNQTPVVRQQIYDYIKSHKEKGLRLAKEVPVGSGSDYYLSSQRLINQLAKSLHAAFGGELKVSAQHFSYNHAAGKNLYRVNAYLEIPEYSKGDVIKKDEKFFYVLGVGAKVKAENLMSGSNETFPYVPQEAVKLPVSTTTVASVSPLEVLHPVSFQGVEPTNSKYAPAEVDIDEEVSVAVDGAYLFLIPHRQATATVKAKRKRHSQKRGTKDDDLINPN